MSEHEKDAEGKAPEQAAAKPAEEPKPQQAAAPKASEQVAVTDEARSLAPEDLAEAAESVRKSLPEQLAALAPSDPADLFRWYAKALETGAVKLPSAPVPPTDAARPKSTVPDADLSKLPPQARMARAYGKPN